MALERLAGVHYAEVSYESRTAVVVFDTAVTASADFIAELERMTGFTAEIVEIVRDSVSWETDTVPEGANP